MRLQSTPMRNRLHFRKEFLAYQMIFQIFLKSMFLTEFNKRTHYKKWLDIDSGQIVKKYFTTRNSTLN